MLYKFINEHVIKPHNGEYVAINGTIYTNPKEEALRAAGYKELEVLELPYYNPETQYVTAKYDASGRKIKVKYIVKAVEE